MSRGNSGGYVHHHAPLLRDSCIHAPQGYQAGLAADNRGQGGYIDDLITTRKSGGGRY